MQSVDVKMTKSDNAHSCLPDFVCIVLQNSLVLSVSVVIVVVRRSNSLDI